MKKTKFVIALLLIAALMIGNMATVGASDIMPLYDNCFYCNFSFVVTNGTGYISIDYDTMENFTSFSSTVKVQRRVLGIFWDTIEIAEGTEEWVVNSTATHDALDCIFPVDRTGTYRAVFEVYFYGQDGTVDVIEDKRTSTYE